MGRDLRAADADLLLTPAEIGLAIRVVVTAANAGGTGSAASSPTAVVEASAPPSNVTPPVLTGLAREGETLAASPGSWAGWPTSYAYAWERSADGGTVWQQIPGAETAAYELGSADLGHVVRVVVTAANAGGPATTASEASASVAPAVLPVNVDPPQLTGTARDGDELAAGTGAWSGTPKAFAFQWQRSVDDGGSWDDVPGASGSAYTPGPGDVGLRLRVTVTASNAAGAVAAASAATEPVLPAPPASTVPPVIGGTPREGETVLATSGDWSGEPTSFAYEWRRCEPDGSGCIAITWADDADYLLRAADVDYTMRVAVSATNAGGTRTAVSEPTAVILPLPPVNLQPPAVTGVPEQGETLAADPGQWESAGSLSFGHVWQRSADGAGWADIPGASGPTHVAGAADVGLLVRVVVTASNGGGDASAPSEGVAVAASGHPTSVEAPTLTGYAQLGRSLAATAGVWSASPTAFAYRWERSADGQAWTQIPGAAGTAYTLGPADVGLLVRVVVTATNEIGPGSAGSHPVAVYPSASNIVATVNTTWRCTGAVDIQLVKVTMRTRLADAVVLGNGCTGRIGRVEVDTWTIDAIKTVNSSTNAAHDLVIESGFAVCHDRGEGQHQDGWQSMGGARLTIRNFVFACGDMGDEFGEGVAQSVVIGRAGAGVTTPTDSVVEHSVLMPGAAHTVALGESVRSGARGSVLCPDRTGDSPFSDFGGAVDPVLEGNEEAGLADPRCASFAAALAWAQSAP